MANRNVYTMPDGDYCQNLGELTKHIRETDKISGRKRDFRTIIFHFALPQPLWSHLEPPIHHSKSNYTCAYKIMLWVLCTNHNVTQSMFCNIIELPFGSICKEPHHPHSVRGLSSQGTLNYYHYRFTVPL